MKKVNRDLVINHKNEVYRKTVILNAGLFIMDADYLQALTNHFISLQLHVCFGICFMSCFCHDVDNV